MAKALMVGAALLAVAGCADMTERQQRAATGTMIGTAGGAAIGAIAGNAALGAGIGAAAGLAGGLIADRIDRNKEAAYQQGYAAGAAN
jgi:hypothetical protein